MASVPIQLSFHRCIWVIFLGGTNENGPYEHGNNLHGDLKMAQIAHF